MAGQHSEISHTSLPGAVVIHDEGSLAGTATAGINFIGGGVSGTVTSGTAVITISGTVASQIPIFDEGVNKGTATAGINIVGPSFSGTVTSGTAILTMGTVSGYEYDYVQKTSNTTLSATSAATANTIVTANAVTFDGSTAAVIEFYCPTTDRSGGATLIALWLYDGSSEVGAIYYSVAVTTARLGIYASYRLTPSAASHTYSIRGSVNASSADINAGAAGSGNFMPCYIRIRKA